MAHRKRDELEPCPYCVYLKSPEPGALVPTGHSLNYVTFTEDEHKCDACSRIYFRRTQKADTMNRPNITVTRREASQILAGDLSRGDFFTFPASMRGVVYVVTGDRDDVLIYMKLGHSAQYDTGNSAEVIPLRLESAEFSRS